MRQLFCTCTCDGEFHEEVKVSQMHTHANLLLNLTLLAENAGIYLHILLAVSAARNYRLTSQLHQPTFGVLCRHAYIHANRRFGDSHSATGRSRGRESHMSWHPHVTVNKCINRDRLREMIAMHG